MKTAIQLLFISGLILLNSCDTNKKITSITKIKKMETTNVKAVATKAMNAFLKDYNATAVKELFADSYIQHNPNIPTGIAPVVGFVPLLEKAGTTVKNHRTISDGNMVVMHNTYNNAEVFGAKEVVTFDVFRIEDGKVAEHWDAIAPFVGKNASGRTQADGPTEITDLDRTQANKELVSNFANDILLGKNPTKITEYISTETYHQHNTMVEDGLDGFSKAVQYLVSQNDMFIYEKTHRVIGEGNFTLAVSEGMWHGKKHAFYDLFRIEGGKIVEHWDVIQEVPEKMAHDNGMF